MSIKAAKTKIFRLSDLNPAAYNPRKIKSENKKGLQASLERFGCVEDIVVNVRGGRNIIVSGHQRYDILIKENGPKFQCPCKVVNLSIEDEKALNLVLNNPNIQGEFTQALPEHIMQLKSELENDHAFLALRLDKLKAEIGTDDEDGEVEFTQEVLEENNYLVFVFDNKLDWQVAVDMFKTKTVQALDSKEGYRKCGIGRVLSGAKLIQAMNGGKVDDFYTKPQKG